MSLGVADSSDRAADSRDEPAPTVEENSRVAGRLVDAGQALSRERSGMIGVAMIWLM